MSVEPLPYSDGPFRLHMGLRSLDPAAWLEPDSYRETDLRLKQELLAAHHGEVLRFVDHRATHDASAELLAMIEAVPGYSTTPNATSAIESCGLATQEDWVVLLDVGGGVPVVAAACVCFPTRWILAEKIGKPMSAVHAPVAFYAEQIGASVDRFMGRLRTDKPMWRMNWNLMDDPAMFQPVRRRNAQRDAAITAGNAGEKVWFRVERQTFRRLPATGAIAFGIKVRQETIAQLGARRGSEALGTLRAALSALPPETIAYKGVGAFQKALDGWLALRTT